MLKVILVDDEVHCVETLSILLKEFCPSVQVVGKCRSAKEAIEAIEHSPPDLVLLDIEMPGMNGFQMLEQLKQIPFAVVFTTSYDQYALQAIRFSALDYLLKPVEPKELIEAINRVAGQKQLPYLEQFQLLLQHFEAGRGNIKKFAVPTIEGFEMITAEDVLRCVANDNYTEIFLKSGYRITVCRTLKQLEEQLRPFKNFLRVHHSYIVNLNEITKYVRGEGGYLTMVDGAVVNVSRSRKQALLDAL